MKAKKYLLTGVLPLTLLLNSCSGEETSSTNHYDTEQEIQKARELLRLNRNFNLDFSKKIVTPLTALDSALVTVRKARLPKFKDYLYKSKLKKDEVISFKNNTNTLFEIK